MSEPDAPAAAPAPPLLRVVKGDPTPEQMAALVAVVAARGSGAPEPVAKPHSGWADRASLLRGALHPGPGAWHASLR